MSRSDWQILQEKEGDPLKDRDIANKVYVAMAEQEDAPVCEYCDGEGCPQCDEDNDHICPHCNGSGEGMYDGSRCSFCKGAGVKGGWR